MLLSAAKGHPNLPEPLHECRELGVHQRGNVPKGVVEHVRLLEVVQLVRPPHPSGGAEPLLGEQGKKVIHRNQTRHDLQTPAGGGLELGRHGVHPGDGRLGQAVHGVEAVEVQARGLVVEQIALPPVQRGPRVVLDRDVFGLKQGRVHGL